MHRAGAGVREMLVVDVEWLECGTLTVSWCLARIVHER